MFKKILLLLISIFIVININYSLDTFADCEYSTWMTLDSFLDWCKPENVVWSTWSLWYEIVWIWWLKGKVNSWITNISLVLWILAVWALVYSWLLLQFAAWEDEKVKKAKDIFKWTIIWFLWLISASWIIALVINIIYSLSQF